MKFAGKVWKLLVGIKDGLVLLFMLLFFALLYAAMTARPPLVAIRARKPWRRLRTSLDG